MNMKPQKPLSKPQAQVQIDLNDAETMKCEDCGNSVFIPAFFFEETFTTRITYWSRSTYTNSSI